MGNYEPFLDNLKYTFQLHLESVNNLEKKAQNIIIISGIMIGFSVGWNRVQGINDEYIVTTFISTSILIASIIYSRSALKVHSQTTPWNISSFFQDGTHTPIYEDGVDTPIYNDKIIKKVLIYDIAKIENGPKYLEDPQLIINKIKYEHMEIKIYLRCCDSALKNIERISKYVKKAERCFILGSISFAIIPLLLIINILLDIL